MPHIKRTEQPARTMRELGELTAMPLMLFSFADVARELQNFLAAPGMPETGLDTDIEDDEWEEIINDFLRVVGNLPGNDIFSDWARSATDRERHALAVQLQRAIAAIDEAEQTVDNEGSATGVLLPASWPQRMMVLLGGSQMPVAWVRELDLLRF